MCQFVETIRLTSGIPAALSLHQARMVRTCAHFFPNQPVPELSTHVPLLPAPVAPVCKWRVVYGRNGICLSEVTPYALRRVTSLRLVTADDIDYTYKSTDRMTLNRLAAKKDDADEVLIVRHGLVTDTSYTNVAFLPCHGNGQWLTPRHPLLCGTMREQLLLTAHLVEADIRPADLHRFSFVMLLNAMLPFGTIVVPISHILK